jgi:hypothetical protein
MRNELENGEATRFNPCISHIWLPRVTQGVVPSNVLVLATNLEALILQMFNNYLQDYSRFGNTAPNFTIKLGA